MELEVLEPYVAKTRNKAAALKFIRKRSSAMAGPRLSSPAVYVPSGAALKEVDAEDLQEVGRWTNNRAENDEALNRRVRAE